MRPAREMAARYRMIPWSVSLRGLKPGRYEFRAPPVDSNSFVQPEPRPIPKDGRNAGEGHRLEAA